MAHLTLKNLDVLDIYGVRKSGVFDLNPRPYVAHLLGFGICKE